MVFSSLEFLCVFLPVVLLLYYLIPSVRMQNMLLVVVSVCFYAYGEPVYVLLLIGSTIVNYICGRLLEKNKNRGIITAAVVANLIFLGVFKYAGMIIITVNQVVGISIPVPEIRLPIGISFYTFQALSYLIDVYWGKVKVQKSYLNLLFYISFFPQLIAGPIVKYHDIEQQLSNRTKDIEEIAIGFRRFIIGMAKKVLISNTVAVAADAVFSLKLQQLNICSAWIGAISYMLQIYFDFSGYSDMAIGMGHMFGFTFPENFQYPYIATSLQEFWRRWHISLSTWFKEYLYIPLGGNRRGKLRTCINKMIVFFCTGLWHGANWTFVIWGLYHGLFLLLEKLFPIKKMPKFLGHLYTLLVVCVGFVIFRADSVGQGIGYIGKLFGGFQFTAETMSLALRQCTPILIVISMLGIAGSIPWKDRLKHNKQAAEVLAYILAILLLILCILSLSSGTYNPFIYFRF